MVHPLKVGLASDAKTPPPFAAHRRCTKTAAVGKRGRVAVASTDRGAPLTGETESCLRVGEGGGQEGTVRPAVLRRGGVWV